MANGDNDIMAHGDNDDGRTVSPNKFDSAREAGAII
jgi:hypothetical protein